MTNHVDFAGRTMRFDYLPSGRLAESIRYLDGQPVSIRTDYDSQFNLLRVVDELDRNVETYVLDIRDRVVAVTNLSGQVMHIEYGVADIVHSVTRFDGSVVSNVWDHVGRLSEQVLTDATNTFQYTLGGRIASVSGSGITVTNVFDGFMRVEQEHTIDAGPARSVAYTWNPVGTVATATDPAGTRTYGYDPADRLTNLSAEAASFTWGYNPDNGAVASVANAQSGIGVGYDYDITDRLTDIAWSGTMPAMSFSMQYSAADMITNVVYASGEKRVYVYDDLDRLTGERHYDASQTLTHNADYAYDLAGNRTQMVRNGVTTTYTLGVGNRLDTWTGGSYAYDSAGNVTNITQGSDTRLLLWNSQYQLTDVHANGAFVESYGYDPLGRRAWTYDGSDTVWHVHDGMHLVADLDESGAVLRSYTWGPGIDNLLAMTVHGASGTDTYYAISDHLGTLHALADETGFIVESYRYDAWGNILGVYNDFGQPISESALGNRFLFQGREYSWATGLYNFRARWYDPITGRWLSKDPIGINGGLNQYVAFANNPVMFVDPLGLCPDDVRSGRQHLQRYQSDLADRWGGYSTIDLLRNLGPLYSWSFEDDRDIRALEDEWTARRPVHIIFRHRGVDYTPSAFGNYAPAYALSQEFGDFRARAGLTLVRALLFYCDSIPTYWSQGFGVRATLQGALDDHRARKYYHHQGLRHARQDRR